MRASARLREMLAEMKPACSCAAEPADKARGSRRPVRAGESSREAPTLSPIEASDREDEVAMWLSDHGIADSWEMASTLSRPAWAPIGSTRLYEVTPPPHLDYGLSYPVRAVESDKLASRSPTGWSASRSCWPQRGGTRRWTARPCRPSTSTRGSGDVDDARPQAGRRHPRWIPGMTATSRSWSLPGELNQVWTNLIDNAIDAMGGDGTLTVRTRADGERLVVEIGDTGSGVPAEVRSRVRAVLHDEGHRQGHRPPDRYRLANCCRAPRRRDQPRIGTPATPGSPSCSPALTPGRLVPWP